MYVLRTLAFLMLPKGERKMGILRNLDIIFSRLKLSINSKRKGAARSIGFRVGRKARKEFFSRVGTILMFHW